MSKALLDVGSSERFGQGGSRRDMVLDREIPRVCAEWFPDNEGNSWTIERTVHDGDIALVMVRSTPNDVGAERFVIWVEFLLGGEFTAQAMYSEDEESRFSLLSTDPGCATDIPSEIVW